MTKDLTCHYGIPDLQQQTSVDGWHQRRRNKAAHNASVCCRSHTHPIITLFYEDEKKGEKNFKGNLNVDINSKFARRKEVQLSLEFGVVVKVERE